MYYTKIRQKLRTMTLIIQSRDRKNTTQPSKLPEYIYTTVKGRRGRAGKDGVGQERLGVHT